MNYQIVFVVATEPTAYVSLERNGQVDFIKTKLTFDNVIPTVLIATSFKNYEKLIFKGNYNPSPHVTQLDFYITRNEENIFVFANTLKKSDDWVDMELISTILTPALAVGSGYQISGMR